MRDRSDNPSLHELHLTPNRLEIHEQINFHFSSQTSNIYFDSCGRVNVSPFLKKTSLPHVLQGFLKLDVKMGKVIASYPFISFQHFTTLTQCKQNAAYQPNPSYLAASQAITGEIFTKQWFAGSVWGSRKPSTSSKHTTLANDRHKQYIMHIIFPLPRDCLQAKRSLSGLFNG